MKLSCFSYIPVEDSLCFVGWVGADGGGEGYGGREEVGEEWGELHGIAKGELSCLFSVVCPLGLVEMRRDDNKGGGVGDEGGGMRKKRGIYVWRDRG